MNTTWASSVFTLHRFLMNPQNDHLPVGLLAQVVEHCTGITEVMGLTSAQAWTHFFQALFSLLLSSIHNCDDRMHLHRMKSHPPGKKTCVLLLDCDCDPALNDCRPCRLSSYALSWVILLRLVLAPVADWSVTYAGAGCKTCRCTLWSSRKDGVA